jgi:stress-induced morphogen
MAGPIENRIREKLMARFAPEHLEVTNESHTHNVPKGSETHFKVLIVASEFEGQSRIQRQRAVNEALAEELKSGVHALTQRALSPSEWAREGAVDGFESPECRGGSKSDRS